MINFSQLFVIFKEDGTIRLLGSTGELELIEANLKPGDTYHWGDEIAREAHGIQQVISGDQLELNIV